MIMTMSIIEWVFLLFTLITSSFPIIPNGFPIVRKLSEEYQDSNTIPGISHVTVAGAVLHGFKEIEVWMETAAPGGRTPVHRHDCEEVFVVLNGSGTLYLASNPNDGSEYPGKPREFHFSTNTTFHVPPNDVHQVINTDEHQDLHLLVVISRPPMKAIVYEDWSTRHKTAKLMEPFVWDAKYYNTHKSPSFPNHEEL